MRHLLELFRCALIRHLGGVPVHHPVSRVIGACSERHGSHLIVELEIK